MLFLYSNLSVCYKYLFMHGENVHYFIILGHYIVV